MKLEGEYFTWTKGDSDVMLSGHFNTREFSCKCSLPTCVQQKIAKELVFRLERVRRQDAKVGLLISSGYRCHEHQQSLREAGYETAKGISQHELGRAADVRPIGMETELLAGHMAQEFRSIGTAKTFVHVDLRDDKERRWTYATL